MEQSGQQYEFRETLNFAASEIALGRQRTRKWIPLISQQLRLRHVYQIFAYNIREDRRCQFYFTLHPTALSAPFYTSERQSGRNPRWNELLFKTNELTNISCVVMRIWKCDEKGDEIILTWGINFSGLLHLGNKLADLHPKNFKHNTVIIFMQGVYFTSRNSLVNEVDKPFYASIKVPKCDVTLSYNLQKLTRLQELQRLLKNKKGDLQNIKDRIHFAREKEDKSDHQDSQMSSYDSNIRFAPQLLTMNSLNKMLHVKPTKAEREAMIKVNKNIEVTRFRIRMLDQARDRNCSHLKRLKQQYLKLEECNEERNSRLISLLGTLDKETNEWNQYKHSMYRRQESLALVGEHLLIRQNELLKELLFIYPIHKLPNENKFTMLGIHLPNSEILLDYQDPGVSVVLGYICHVIIMCSIFLQVPLRHPMKHFGSRSVIYNQVYPDIPDKEREFPLYTKGKDKVHFSYAVFLLNKNIGQLRWYLHHRATTDLKETLKNLRSFLLGDDVVEARHVRYADKKSRPITSGVSTSTLDGDRSQLSFDKLVSPSLSSNSSSNLNDPLLDRLHEDMKRDRNAGGVKKISEYHRSPSSRTSKQKSKCSGEALTVPEAYLNKQISKDIFHKCASGDYKFDEFGHAGNGCVKIGEDIEEFHAEVDTNSRHSDSIEEGTDPLDPSINLETLASKSIDINMKNMNKLKMLNPDRLCRSAGTGVDEIAGYFKDLDIGNNSNLNPVFAKSEGTSSMVPPSGQVKHQDLLDRLLTGDTSLLSSKEVVFPEECLRMSLHDIASPLTERTDRLLSSNQSFNMFKHRPIE